MIRSNGNCFRETKKNRSLRGHVLTGNECYTINIVYVIVDMLL